MGCREEGLEIVGRIGGGGERGDVRVGIVGLVEKGHVLWWVGFEKLDGGGDFGGVHYLMNLCGIERGDGLCWSRARVVALRCVKVVEGKADWRREFNQQILG